jgi:hypothetical protein
MKIYNDIPQNIDLEQPCLFNKNGLIRGPIAHVAGSGDIIIGSVGYFLVIIKLFHEFAVQTGLFLNGVLLPGSVVGEAATTSMAISHSIIEVELTDLLPNSDSPTGVGAVLQVRNHSSYITPVILNGREGSGSDLNQINASCIVIQLCDDPDAVSQMP